MSDEQFKVLLDYIEAEHIITRAAILHTLDHTEETRKFVDIDRDRARAARARGVGTMNAEQAAVERAERENQDERIRDALRRLIAVSSPFEQVSPNLRNAIADAEQLLNRPAAV